MFLCECDKPTFCGKTMPKEVYDALKDLAGGAYDLYIVHRDHIAENDVEIQREGEWVLVREAQNEQSPT